MSKVGSLKDFDSTKEAWCSYVECFEYFCLANSVKAELQVPIFLTSHGCQCLQHCKKPLSTKGFQGLIMCRS